MGTNVLSCCLFVLLFAQAAAVQDVSSLIAQGDALYEKRQDPDQARLAVQKYGEAARLDPGSYEARWKAAKALFYIGRITASREEKMRTFDAAVAQAKEAVRLDPARVEGHFWLAAGYGEYGQAKGVLKSLFLRDDIQRELDAAIRIDPEYDCGAAYIALGRVFFKVPRLFGGSLEKSRAYLEKARDMCPRTTTTLLYLAETYWALKERALALRTLEELRVVEPYPSAVPEANEDKKEGARLFREFTNERTGHEL